MEIVGEGSPEGGCQWVLFPNECSGASVAQSGGFDYGSWIQFSAVVDEADYISLQNWDSLTYAEQAALEQHLYLKYR